MTLKPLFLFYITYVIRNRQSAGCCLHYVERIISIISIIIYNAKLLIYIGIFLPIKKEKGGH